MALGWFWWAERPVGAFEPGHALVGLGVLGLAGFVLALAPATWGLAPRQGGAMLLAGAVMAAWLVRGLPGRKVPQS